MDLQLESIFEKRPQHRPIQLCTRWILLRLRENIVTIRVDPSWASQDLHPKASRVGIAAICINAICRQDEISQLSAFQCHAAGRRYAAATASGPAAALVWFDRCHCERRTR